MEDEKNSPELLNPGSLKPENEINREQLSQPVKPSEDGSGMPKIIRTAALVLIPVITLFFLLVFFIWIVPSIIEMAPHSGTKVVSDKELKKDATYKKEISLLNKDIQRLRKKYNSYTSGQSYIVINTTANRFALYRNKTLVREGLCSSGANKILQAGKKTFVFKTPKGKFSITNKRKNPYWHRSDWDFIEQGLPIPPKDDPSRWEEGVLGDYALDLVDGYMLHGTIYKRLMGMPVTHGCIRFGDEDLEVVFNTLNVGSKVYIF